MKRADLSFQEIYNLLLAGHKVVLQFPDSSVAENFRTRMHHHKTKQTQALVNLGMVVEDEGTVFQFKTQKDKDSEAIVAHCSFVAKSPLKTYPVLILEEKDEESAKISESLGATTE